jgi:protein-tyrosine phosphatase
LARAAVDAGVDTIVVTPHVSWDWPNTYGEIAAGTLRMRTELVERSVPVRLRAGAEVGLTKAIALADADLRALTLGGGPWLLIEPPYVQPSVFVESALELLRQRGHRIVLAHVERCAAFIEDLSLLERLVGSGMLASVTAGSLVGRFGASVERFSHRIVARGLVHNVASDAHDCDGRAPGLAPELADAGLGAHAAWLTNEVPGAILAGTQIPPPPAAWPALRRRARLAQRIRQYAT